MHIHSMLPCIDSGILCIQHTMHGLTTTNSYRVHYYNQDHQYLLSWATKLDQHIQAWHLSIFKYPHYEVSYLYHSLEFIKIKLLPAWVLLKPLALPV